MITGFLVFFWEKNDMFQVNISLYLYLQSHISPKDIYRELKCFIKPFTRLETSSTFSNSHQKNSAKNSAFEFRLIKRFFQLTECSFRSIEQESNSDRAKQKLQDFFFTISIDRAKVSTHRKCLTSNFHLKNSIT